MLRKAATYNDHTDLQEYTETVTAYIITCSNHRIIGSYESVMKHSDLETKQLSKLPEPICPKALRRQGNSMDKKNKKTSMIAETL